MGFICGYYVLGMEIFYVKNLGFLKILSLVFFKEFMYKTHLVEKYLIVSMYKIYIYL